ncbi:MAG: pyrroline-5-carboxylate reductase [Akkermansiaceae bacterium]
MSSEIKLGLIGCGKMGRALIEGALKNKVVAPENVFISSRTPSAVETITSELGVTALASNVEVAQNSDVVLLCTKPADIPLVLLELANESDCLTSTLLISAAAGLTIVEQEKILPLGVRFVRCMPNTPALIGQGAAAYALGSAATDADAELTCKVLGATGSVIEVKEKLMNAVTGVSGSGPAYVYTFIESLADGGVAEGLPRAQALELAVKTVQGAAMMVSETGLHPALLRDMVTSPGGTTIEALTSLEANGFRSAVISAVRTASKKAEEMGK